MLYLNKGGRVAGIVGAAAVLLVQRSRGRDASGGFRRLLRLLLVSHNGHDDF